MFLCFKRCTVVEPTAPEPCETCAACMGFPGYSPYCQYWETVRLRGPNNLNRGPGGKGVNKR